MLAAIGMIYGFVEINSPQKMLGANMAVEGIIHEEIEVTLEDNLEDDDEIDDFYLGNPNDTVACLTELMNHLGGKDSLDKTIVFMHRSLLST